MTEPAESGAPHLDPARFDEIVEAAGPDSCIVVIDSWMGPLVRAWCQPEDVWQEALAQSWRDRAQHTWTGPRAWRTWVLSIARNRVMDLSRTAGAAKRGGDTPPVRMTDLRAPGGESVGDIFPAGSATPSRIASHRERAEILKRALAGLPDDLRDVVRMHLFEERPMAEIAADLGIGLSAAWYRFRRGTEQFTEAVESLRTRSGG